MFEQLCMLIWTIPLAILKETISFDVDIDLKVIETFKIGVLSYYYSVFFLNIYVFWW